MNNKQKNIGVIFGLIFTIASAVFVIALSTPFFTEPGLKDSLFDVGVDSMGALFCAALFFGCIKQNGDGTNAFRILVILVSAGFAVNEVIRFSLGVPKLRTLCFLMCMISKLIDLVMIYLFYRYVKATLNFTGKFDKIAEKVIIVLLAIETVVMLSNIFYPTTFYVDVNGVFHKTALSWAEDIYLAITSIITAALIIKCSSPIGQKASALTFVIFPIAEYILIQGEFGSAAQYGMVLMSLIIMYCVIFNDKSRKLASTQTDLRIAAKIQADALPPMAPEFADHLELSLRGIMNTAKEVGGDFYDYFPIDENRICFLIADVSGKGTPAALFMMTAKTMIKDYALTSDSTSEIFTAVNARLCENNKEGMFATAWIGILDKRTMTLQYTNAGHNYPVLQRRDRPCETMDTSHGLFLAGLEFTNYRQSEITLCPGDRLLLYTDGVTEAHDKTKALYGTDRLEKMLDDARNLPGEQVLDKILDDIKDFAQGVPQFDDITMVILTIKE